MFYLTLIGLTHPEYGAGDVDIVWVVHMHVRVGDGAAAVVGDHLVLGHDLHRLALAGQRRHDGTCTRKVVETCCLSEDNSSIAP